MISILAASLLGSWTYAGFLSEPTSQPQSQPQPPPPSVSAPIAPAPARSDKPKRDEANPQNSSTPPKEPATKPTASDAPKEPSMKPTVSNRSKVAPATTYRATDAWSQTWEHSDPAFLSSFIESRNRIFSGQPNDSSAIFSYSSYLPARASRCSTGRCY